MCFKIIEIQMHIICMLTILKQIITTAMQYFSKIVGTYRIFQYYIFKLTRILLIIII